jgi:hypothetical protein
MEFWKWEGSCVACGRRKKGLNGLFCGNFANAREGWKACNAVWCGTCYTPHKDDRFHYHERRDESGFEWKRPGDELRFKYGRDGNHLAVLFQCDDCVFRNLTGRLLNSDSARDGLLTRCIRRVNLDAMWGLEGSTVRSTVRSVKYTINLLQQMGVEPQYPPLGPFPVGDDLGYGVAVAMVLKSLEPGKYGHTSGEPDSNGLWMPTESGETWMLWVPPPAASDVALEELLNSRHKRDYINHVVVIPRLMTHLWRKRLHKLSDLLLEVPAGSRSFWPAYTNP